MKILKLHKSAIMVLVTFLFFGYVVQQSHIFYGGYERMLYNGLAEVLNTDVLTLKGYISIHDPSYLESHKATKLKLNMEGEIYFDRNEGRLDFFIVDAYDLNFLKIGSINKDVNHYYLITELGEVEPIILDELINGVIRSEEEQAELWDELYTDVNVTNQYQSKKGKSGEINHIKTINYTFDLSRVLDQSFIEDLSKQIGFNINFEVISLICHLDSSGQIESMALKGDELLSMELMIIEPEKDIIQKFLKVF